MGQPTTLPPEGGGGETGDIVLNDLRRGAAPLAPALPVFTSESRQSGLTQGKRECHSVRVQVVDAVLEAALTVGSDTRGSAEPSVA